MPEGRRLVTALGKWVIAPPRKTLVVGVADMVASNDSSAEIVTYSLGSCLGITIYDPVKKIGGLLHVMLPDSKIDSAKAVTAPLMFVDTGVPRLFQAVYNLGADRSRLVVKVAGGAQLLDQAGMFNIGEPQFPGADRPAGAQRLCRAGARRGRHVLAHVAFGPRQRQCHHQVARR